MTLQGVLLMLVIAGGCGIVAEFVLGLGAGSFLVSVVAGLVGAALGDWLSRLAGLPSFLPVSVEGQTIDLAWTVFGAVLFLALVSILKRMVLRR